MYKENRDLQPPHPKNLGCKYNLWGNDQVCVWTGCQAEPIIEKIIKEHKGGVEARQERIEEIIREAKDAGCPNTKDLPY